MRAVIKELSGCASLEVKCHGRILRTMVLKVIDDFSLSQSITHHQAIACGNRVHM